MRAKELMRRRASLEMALALVALFVALTGTAAGLKGKNSVDSGDIKNGQVKSPDLQREVIPTLDGAESAQSGLEQGKSKSTAASTLFVNAATDLSLALADNGVDNGDVDNSAAVAALLAGESVPTGSVSPETPAAEVTIPAAVTLPAESGPVKLPLSTARYDTASMSEGNDLCLADRVDGWGIYKVNASVAWESYPHGYRFAYLVKNDANQLASESTRANTSGPTWQHLSAQVRLGPEDCLSLYVVNFAVNPNNPAERSDVDVIKAGSAPYINLSWQVPGPRPGTAGG